MEMSGRDHADPPGVNGGSDIPPEEQYSQNGNAHLALDILDRNKAATSVSEPVDPVDPVEEYNRLVLKHIVSLNVAKDGAAGNDLSRDFLINLDLSEKAYHLSEEKKMIPSGRKRSRNEWIMTYNRALVRFASGNVRRSAEICSGRIKHLIEKKQKVPEELLFVASQSAFLLLEGILALSIGSHVGIQSFQSLPTTDAIIEWLDRLELESKPQIKFMLALYKSRLDFQFRDGHGKLADAKVRSSRKELKHAMEIFQQKLRPSSGDSHSLASSSFSEDNMQQSGAQSQTPMPRILQSQNQAALNLKANTEQLKGNLKKSLILCGEAQSAVADSQDSYESVHANNLAVVYETNGKRHLALHTISKALRTNSFLPCFANDGTARPNPTIKILYNSAICASQAHNWMAAYECMATCVLHSSVMSKRPRCWLRMAEACIGLHAKQRQGKTGVRFLKIEENGETKGIRLGTDLGLSSTKISDVDWKLADIVATAEDLEHVRRCPLPRAYWALKHALKLFQESSPEDVRGLVSARLAMSYVSLEIKEYREALKYAKLVLESTDLSVLPPEGVGRSLYQRQHATARMYASEASCTMGEAIDSMRFLVGDGKNDAFDRLAFELGGVTIETAASSVNGKAKLAKAQAMVRCSASAASATLGNLPAAKQLAMSAQAIEDSCSTSRAESHARRALIYCMLQEDNFGAALNMLQSIR